MNAAQLNFFTQQDRAFILLIVTLLLLLLTVPALAQEKCGTVPYEALLKERKALSEKKLDFESWIQSRIIEKKTKKQATHATAENSEDIILTIPVVVHIIHNGESQGLGANISMARVLSQIKVLNEDFRRLNADTLHTPTIFADVASDTKIEFVLAQRDPEGLPTNGVTRRKGPKSAYAITDNWDLKALNYWPAEEYLNIWVAPLKNSLLGYAQFPQSDTTPGLEDASANRATDGVVIDHNYFGNNNNVSPPSTGRTATHEIGHFLGLRHIWGDGGCETDDFCDDTPASDGANYNCPSEEVISCGNKDMFQNFMDYTNDGCMNLFTHNQKERIQVVLENSPRRASLLTSKGGEPPAVTQIDLGIKKITAPVALSCEGAVTPELLLRNYGENDVSDFKILLKVNGDTVDSLYQEISLSPLDSIKVTFPSFALEDAADFIFEFIIKEVNHTLDENPDNNSRKALVNIPEYTALPFTENFEQENFQGSIENPDERYGWEIANAPEKTEDNQALMLNCYAYKTNLGERDFYNTPIFDLQGLKTATLKFKVAYAQFLGGSQDGLMVGIAKDCGIEFKQEDILLQDYGEDLSTVKNQSDPFIPQGRLEWKQVSIDLTSFVGLSDLRIYFAAINGYGNNIYLDDISISGEQDLVQDIKLVDVNIPPVTCDQPFTPEISVVNKGQETISSFTGTSHSPWETGSFAYSGAPIPPNDTVYLTLPEISPALGKHALDVTISMPDGEADDYPEDNFKSTSFIVDTLRDFLPIRENFTLEGEHELKWYIHNPDNSTTWELIETPGIGKSNAIYHNNYSYGAMDEKDWLISPLLNFSDIDYLKLSFLVSYAYNFNYQDKLQILVSKDCGGTYSDVAFEASGEELSSDYSSSSLAIKEKAAWKKISIPLDEFIGEESVRIAFVMNNGYGNNLYLDDIEFFIAEEPEYPLPDKVKFGFPNPSKGILPVTFNLEEKETVQIELYDIRGKRLYQETFSNTLNQKYQLDFTTIPAAMYLLKISGESFNDTKRLLLER